MPAELELSKSGCLLRQPMAGTYGCVGRALAAGASACTRYSNVNKGSSRAALPLLLRTGVQEAAHRLDCWRFIRHAWQPEDGEEASSSSGRLVAATAVMF